MIKTLTDNPKKLFNSLLLLWVIINLAQAAFSSLIGDEAYYWMFSQNLDWGFYDHPPMIAFFIKVGYSIIQSELGARLLTVFCFGLFLVFLWKLIDVEKTKGNIILYFLICFSIPVFQLYGFLATPDSPLLLFSVLFLYTYKQFLEKNDSQNAIFLGILMAALLYSKYHGLLLIGFTVISNFKLLKNYKFLTSIGIGIILFIPHLLWQYNNYFPTLEYHLVIRVEGFKTEHPFNYLGGQLMINNPFIFPVMIYLLFRRKFKDSFERALIFNVIGFFAFFLLSSFRDHVEPHWTAAALIPLFALTFKTIVQKKKIASYAKITSLIVLVIIFVLRSGTIINYIPLKFLQKEFFNNKLYVEEIHKIANSTPVVFNNAYQKSSMYNFYSKGNGNAYSYNDIFYKKNQYSIWKCDKKLYGKKVVHIPNFKSEMFNKKVLQNGKELYYNIYDSFKIIQRDFIDFSMDDIEWNDQAKEASVKFKVYNPFDSISIHLNRKTDNFMFYAIFNGTKEYKSRIVLNEDLETLNVGDTIVLSGHFKYPQVTKGKYKFTISSKNRYLPLGFHSDFNEIEL